MRAIIFFGLVFFTNSIFSQVQKSSIESYKTFATAQLDSLKNNGALIVILKSKTRAIEAYENAGNKAVAKEMLDKLQIQNKKIVRAFRQYWTFCPLYFVYSKNLVDIHSGRRDSIFVDTTMQINNNISLEKPFYIFFDYGTFYEIQNKSHDSAPSKWKDDQYKNFDPSEGIPVKSDCIVVKDKKMCQFRYPFPDYAQTWGTNNGIKRAAEILNTRFKNAYKLGFDINAAF